MIIDNMPISLRREKAKESIGQYSEILIINVLRGCEKLLLFCVIFVSE